MGLPGVYNCVGINTCLASSLGYVCFHCSVDAKPNGIARYRVSVLDTRSPPNAKLQVCIQLES